MLLYSAETEPYLAAPKLPKTPKQETKILWKKNDTDLKPVNVYYEHLSKW